MVDQLSISGLIAYALIGVHAHEHVKKQVLGIELSFDIDIEQAASRDFLPDTHDYAGICQAVITFVENTPCFLLETLVKKLSQHLSNQFQLKNLQLKITKKPLDLPGVSVSCFMSS